MIVREITSGATVLQILHGMVFDTPTLARIAARWETTMFGKARKGANRVGQWCIDFHAMHGQAPQDDIEGLCAAWGQTQQDEAIIGETEKLVRQVMEIHAGRTSEINAAHLADQAANFFNAARVAELLELTKGHLDNGKTADALEALAKFHRVEMGTGEFVSVLHDREATIRAFETGGKGLFPFGKGAVREFFGEHLEREGFISFMGKEKVGKTFWLIETAHQAILHRCKVLFFAVGDMSQGAMLKRFALRRGRKPHSPRTVKWPVSIKRPATEKFALPEFLEIEHREVLTADDALRDAERLKQRGIKSLDDHLRLICYPNSTASVKMLEGVIQDHARQGFTPDVVIVDYADILGAPKGVQDSREQINTNWKQMRALSQSQHCLLVTATQADAKSYEADSIRRKNFADDKRKYGHVTGMVSINQTDDEKKLGVTRLGWVLLREGEFHEDRFVHCAGCLPLGRPVVRSCW